jgi:hypothetical protein
MLTNKVIRNLGIREVKLREFSFKRAKERFINIRQKRQIVHIEVRWFRFETEGIAVQTCLALQSDGKRSFLLSAKSN